MRAHANIGCREMLIVSLMIFVTLYFRLIGLEKPAQDALVSAPKVAKEEQPMEPVAS